MVAPAPLVFPFISQSRFRAREIHGTSPSLCLCFKQTQISNHPPTQLKQKEGLLFYHGDQQTGSSSNWLLLSQAYGILVIQRLVHRTHAQHRMPQEAGFIQRALSLVAILHIRRIAQRSAPLSIARSFLDPKR